MTKAFQAHLPIFDAPFPFSVFRPQNTFENVSIPLLSYLSSERRHCNRFRNTPHCPLVHRALDFDVEELQAKGQSDETRGKEVRDRPSVFGDLG